MQHKNTEENQLHPALPQQIMANEERWSSVYSDHVPILSFIPFPESNNSNFEHINMISWNVLAHDSNNALAKGKADSCGETKTQEEYRHVEIVKSVASMINKNAPIHLITLQEAGDAELAELLVETLKSLGDNWVIAPNRDHGSMTLYDKRYFSSARKVETQEFKVDTILGSNVNELTLKDSTQSIMVCNCHANYSASPIKHEEAINAALSKGSIDKKVIVTGDFNTTCMPVNRDTSNIATAATPSKFSNDGRQGTNSLDACYHSTLLDSGLTASQAITVQLNPVNGEKYTEQELPPIKNVDEEIEKNHVGKMRMAINIDNQQGDSINVNGMTLSEYENHLRKTSPFDSIFLLPKGTDRTTAQNLLPGAAYLTKQEDGTVCVDIASFTRKILGKPTILTNFDIASLEFPINDQNRLEIKSGQNKPLFDQIKKQKPKWEPSIYVREATNMRNERGMAIQVPKAVYNNIINQNQGNLEFTANSDSDTERYNIILCKRENIPQLHLAMQKYSVEQMLVRANGRISNLLRSEMSNVTNAWDALYPEPMKPFADKLAAELALEMAETDEDEVFKKIELIKKLLEKVLVGNERIGRVSVMISKTLGAENFSDATDILIKKLSKIDREEVEKIEEIQHIVEVFNDMIVKYKIDKQIENETNRTTLSQEEIAENVEKIKIEGTKGIKGTFETLTQRVVLYEKQDPQGYVPLKKIVDCMYEKDSGGKDIGKNLYDKAPAVAQIIQKAALNAIHNEENYKLGEKVIAEAELDAQFTSLMRDIPALIAMNEQIKANKNNLPDKDFKNLNALLKEYPTVKIDEIQRNIDARIVAAYDPFAEIKVSETELMKESPRKNRYPDEYASTIEKLSMELTEFVQKKLAELPDLANGNEKGLNVKVSEISNSISNYALNDIAQYIRENRPAYALLAANRWSNIAVACTKRGDLFSGFAIFATLKMLAIGTVNSQNTTAFEYLDSFYAGNKFTNNDLQARSVSGPYGIPNFPVYGNRMLQADAGNDYPIVHEKLKAEIRGFLIRSKQQSGNAPLSLFQKKLDYALNNANKCELISMPLPPPSTDTLARLPIKNAAYVRSGDELFYVNKEKNEVTKIPIDKTIIKEFDEKMQPKSEVARSLSEDELKKIAFILFNERINNLTEEDKNSIGKIEFFSPASIESDPGLEKFNDSEKEKARQAMDVALDTFRDQLIKIKKDRPATEQDLIGAFQKTLQGEKTTSGKLEVIETLQKALKDQKPTSSKFEELDRVIKLIKQNDGTLEFLPNVEGTFDVCTLDKNGNDVVETIPIKDLLTHYSNYIKKKIEIEEAKDAILAGGFVAKSISKLKDIQNIDNHLTAISDYVALLKEGDNIDELKVKITNSGLGGDDGSLLNLDFGYNPNYFKIEKAIQKFKAILIDVSTSLNEPIANLVKLDELENDPHLAALKSVIISGTNIFELAKLKVHELELEKKNMAMNSYAHMMQEPFKNKERKTLDAYVAKLERKSQRKLKEKSQINKTKRDRLNDSKLSTLKHLIKTIDVPSISYNEKMEGMLATRDLVLGKRTMTIKNLPKVIMRQKTRAVKYLMDYENSLKAHGELGIKHDELMTKYIIAKDAKRDYEAWYASEKNEAKKFSEGITKLENISLDLAETVEENLDALPLKPLPKALMLKQTEMATEVINEIYATEKTFRNNIKSFFEAMTNNLNMLPPDERPKLQRFMEAYKNMADNPLGDRDLSTLSFREKEEGIFRMFNDPIFAEQSKHLLSAMVEMDALNKLLGEFRDSKVFYIRTLRDFKEKTQLNYDNFNAVTNMPTQRIVEYKFLLKSLQQHDADKNVDPLLLRVSELANQSNTEMRKLNPVNDLIRLIVGTSEKLVALKEKVKAKTASTDKTNQINLIDTAINKIRKISYEPKDNKEEVERKLDRLLKAIIEIQNESRDQRAQSKFIAVDALSTFDADIKAILKPIEHAKESFQLESNVKIKTGQPHDYDLQRSHLFDPKAEDPKVKLTRIIKNDELLCNKLIDILSNKDIVGHDFDNLKLIDALVKCKKELKGMEGPVNSVLYTKPKEYRDTLTGLAEQVKVIHSKVIEIRVATQIQANAKKGESGTEEGGPPIHHR